MVRTVPERSTVERQLGEQAERIEAFLRSLPPDAAATPVPTCDGWTVAEVAAHVLTLWRRAISDLRRSDRAEDTAELNAVCLVETPERDLSQLAELLAADGATARTNLAALPDDLTFPFHAGTTTTVVPASCVIVEELVVHGFDIASATGRPWPIDDEVAATVLDGMDGLIRAGWLTPADRRLLDRVRDQLPPSGDLLLELVGRRPPTTEATADLVGALRPL